MLSPLIESLFQAKKNVPDEKADLLKKILESSDKPQVQEPPKANLTDPINQSTDFIKKLFESKMQDQNTNQLVPQEQADPLTEVKGKLGAILGNPVPTINNDAAQVASEPQEDPNSLSARLKSLLIPQKEEDVNQEYDKYFKQEPIKTGFQQVSDRVGDSVKKGDILGTLGNALGILGTPQGLGLLSAFGDKYQRASVGAEAQNAEKQETQDIAAKKEAIDKQNQLKFQIKKQKESDDLQNKRLLAQGLITESTEAGKEKRTQDQLSQQAQLTKAKLDSLEKIAIKSDETKKEIANLHKQLNEQTLALAGDTRQSKREDRLETVKAKAIENLRKYAPYQEAEKAYDETQKALDELNRDPQVFRALGPISLVRSTGLNRINHYEIEAAKSFGSTPEKMHQVVADWTNGKYDEKNKGYIEAYLKHRQEGSAKTINEKLDNEAKRISTTYKDLPLEDVNRSFQFDKKEIQESKSPAQQNKIDRSKLSPGELTLFNKAKSAPNDPDSQKLFTILRNKYRANQ